MNDLKLDDPVRLRAISVLDECMIDLQKERYGLKPNSRKEERVEEAINKCQAAIAFLSTINDESE